MRPSQYSTPRSPAQVCLLPRQIFIPAARVGFLVGHRGCFYQRAEGQTIAGQMYFQRSGLLQSPLDQSFRQWVFDEFLKSAPPGETSLLQAIPQTAEAISDSHFSSGAH